MNFRLIIFSIFLLCISLAANSREITLQVVVTTDVHGRLFSYDFLNDRPASTSLASVHAIVQGARARNREIILLDNGDLIQGTPAAYYGNFVQQHRRNLFSRVLNFMKYDAATVGNHDIEAGPQVYNRIKQEFEFPWLGANILDASSQKPYFTPYTIIQRQGVRVAVLGLSTTGVPNWLPPQLWEGLEFQCMVQAAQYWVPYILENEKPDVLIGLFHSGLGPESYDKSGPSPESVSLYIASNVPGFDIVFTGHDHRERNQTITNSAGDEVLIMGPAPYAESLAVAEIKLERTGRRQFTKKGIRGELASTKGVAPSREFIRAFSKDVEEILTFANEAVGELKYPMASIDAFYGSAPFADLIHKIQLNLTDADISFSAPLTFNEVLPAGTIRVRDFFKLYQYENYLYAMELSGREIQDYLEYSYSLWFNQMSEPDDHLLLFRVDENGRPLNDRSGSRNLKHPFFNFDSAAGLCYTIDVSRPAGQRVNILSMEDGSDFDPDKIYRVAINSYRGSGGGGHLTSGAGIDKKELSSRIVFTTQRDLRAELIDFFRQNQLVEVEARGNWKVLPEEWAETGRRRDEQILF
jgi:2',3'-cyclic-nucleotide 2'-phosphodiesterase / 3'-nucleotidase